MEKRNVTPRVSVILPVYNSSSYLEQAVDSLLKQSFGDFELLAVDDGSTDSSRSILEQASERDPRVRVLSQQNGGVALALNAGIKVAKGEFIARMDADDISLPDRFSLQVSFLEMHPCVVAIGGQIVLVDPEGRELCPMPMPKDHLSIDEFHLNNFTSALCHPATMIRKDALVDIGGYDPKFLTAQDLDLWLRLAEVGQLSNLESVVLHYRQHPTSIGYERQHEQRQSGRNAVLNAMKRRSLKSKSLPKDPEKHSSSVFERWGWWALGAGNVSTARLYARKALLARPTSALAWRLFFCTLRGY